MSWTKCAVSAIMCWSTRHDISTRLPCTNHTRMYHLDVVFGVPSAHRTQIPTRQSARMPMLWREGAEVKQEPIIEYDLTPMQTLLGGSYFVVCKVALNGVEYLYPNRSLWGWAYQIHDPNDKQEIERAKVIMQKRAERLVRRCNGKLGYFWRRKPWCGLL